MSWVSSPSVVVLVSNRKQLYMLSCKVSAQLLCFAQPATTCSITPNACDRMLEATYSSWQTLLVPVDVRELISIQIRWVGATTEVGTIL